MYVILNLFTHGFWVYTDEVTAIECAKEMGYTVEEAPLARTASHYVKHPNRPKELSGYIATANNGPPHIPTPPARTR